MTQEKLSTRYFGFHYKALRMLGIGKFHNTEDNNFDNYPTIKYTVYGFICTVVILIGYTCSETAFAIKAWENKRESSLQFFAFTLVGVHIFASIKILILIKNNKLIQKIVRVLEIDSAKFNGDPKILAQSVKFTKIVTGFFVVMGEITILFMAIHSITVDFERKRLIRVSNYTLNLRRDTPFTAYVPWNTDDDWPYVAGFIFCVGGMFWVGTTLIICDTMVASIMTHISGQFRMVQKVVENIGDKALDILTQKMNTDKFQRTLNTNFQTQKEKQRVSFSLKDSNYLNFDKDEYQMRKDRVMMYFSDDDFDVAITYCMKEAIEYHQLIIEITTDLQAAYNKAFLCQTLSSFYVIGLILVQTAQDVTNIYSLRFFNTIGFLASILWQLFIQTYSANEITIEASRVSICAYNSRWYYGSHRCCKLLAILLQKAQRDLYLTAGDFAPMSNALFVSIIKNAYQIFTLITTVMTPENK